MRENCAIPDTYELTVITITRRRPELLRRAMRTIRDQDYPHSIEHLIVVDDDAERYRGMVPDQSCHTAPSGAPRFVRWHFAARQAGDRSGPPVLGRLRNAAVRLAETPLVAFLDDDNLLERHHFSSLLHCMIRTGCTAVHSQRRLVNRDGLPYLTRLSPWKRNIPEAAARYAQLRRHCVYVPWSNIVRDQVQPRDVPQRIQMVDTSEWLFTKSQIMATPFGETFSEEDWHSMTGEDNKLLAALVEADVPVASSHMPTLHYTLGGFSNNFDAQHNPDGWRRSR